MGWQRIVADTFGAPEVLQLHEIAETPRPGPGEALVRIEAAGVGYTDTILRRGQYVDYTDGLPLTPGYDFAGTVEALGPDTIGLAIGTRVCDMPMNGSYGTYLIRPVECLVPVPDAVPAADAVQVPLMYMTAWQMLTREVSLPRGASVLVVGASGSVGRALVRLARHLGLAPIGTASAANLAAVRALGATAIDYREPALGEAIRAAAGGDGVTAAFDAVGGTSWQTSWDALAHGGTLVAYGLQGLLDGQEAQAVAMASLGKLNGEWPAAGRTDGTDRKTSFYNILGRRRTHPQDYRADAGSLLDLMAAGAIGTDPVEELPLSAAADAHRLIAAGGLDRRLILTPSSEN